MTDRNRNTSSRSNADFQDAAKRLEEAVSDLMSNAGARVTESASQLLNDATDAIRNELSMNSASNASDKDQSSDRERRQRHDAWSQQLNRGPDGPEDGGAGPSQRGDSLQRDTRNRKIAGVCAGIARYYGVESWVVRCLAITGLLFMPQIVFPGYWIAYFVMGSDGNAGSQSRRSRRRTRRSRRRESGSQAETEAAYQEQDAPKQPPRARLRSARSAFDDLEMRLRRMESHVTSGRYDLQRELGKIDDSAAPA